MQQRVLVPGDVVWIRQRKWLVERSRRDGDVMQVDVLSDRGTTTFLSPFDRIVAPRRRSRLRRVSAAAALRRLAALASAATSARVPASAVDADVRLWPFQLEPALAVIGGVRRILLADEVGLGKTIQAGLAIAETCRRRASARVLVVVPAGLTSQWVDELSRRFSIRAIGADAGQLDRLSRQTGRGDNVWRRRGVWMVSVDFLKQPHVISALPPEPWDLVVFDEAHALCGDSQRYDAAAAIAARARVLLLLTATPHGGDNARFDRLLALGSIPDEAQTLIAFRRTRADLSLPRTRRIRWRSVTPTTTERDVLDTLRSFERVVLQTAARTGGGDASDAPILLLSVFHKRALSSMHALDVSLRRRLAWIDRAPADPEPMWRQAHLFDTDSDALSEDDARFLTANSGLDRGHERLWLCRLIRLIGNAAGGESKVRWLRTLLRRTPEPVIVFTEFRHTLETLEQALRDVRTLTSLHGGQTSDQQHASLSDFLGGGATLLLATDVASQGLNMQARARWVICFDLPWNPARLEQRVGRVDRLGQERPVHATMVLRRHSLEAGVLTRLSKRILAAAAATHGLAFGDWRMTEDLLRRQIIAGDRDVESPASPQQSLPISTSWARIGRAAAHHLLQRRRLRPRHPRAFDAASCAFVTSLDRLRAISRLSSGNIGIYSVPLLDRRGDVVEHQLIAIDFGHTVIDREWLREHEQHLHGFVTKTARARQRRVARWLRRRAEHVAATERALKLADAQTQAPLEIGLFDRRQLTLADVHSEARMERDRIADARVDEYFRSALVDIGSPVLELLLVKPA